MADIARSAIYRYLKCAMLIGKTGPRFRCLESGHIIATILFTLPAVGFA